MIYLYMQLGIYSLKLINIGYQVEIKEEVRC